MKEVSVMIRHEIVLIKREDTHIRYFSWKDDNGCQSIMQEWDILSEIVNVVFLP